MNSAFYPQVAMNRVVSENIPFRPAAIKPREANIALAKKTSAKRIFYPAGKNPENGKSH
jgi:hypothetical protein